MKITEFAKNAIQDRLRELNEEKESLDYTIIDLEKKLKDLKTKQSEYDKIIKETLEFLNAAKSSKAAKQTENPKPGQERVGTPKGNNSGTGEGNQAPATTNPTTRKAQPIRARARQ